ncbi:hypothetical protein B0A48_09570 [Cryoendolithus antarcticus]|uniref:Uncharacterized protein n=1 Tax=Cryoendolithus antarcticus TaxID=1507870 RepID=A0A1V8T0A6_9PEZI|nr:hypothetical protein B0A48_09570 [Cryoendolithus antarcticus]
MPPSRIPHDPFTEATATTSRPATSFASAATTAHNLRTQQPSRSTSSTATSRSRQQAGLFAPTLSRRPPNRATSSFESDVLADETEEDELTASQQLVKQRQARPVRGRHGSPDGKYARAQKLKSEDEEFVKRRADGGYLKDYGMDGAFADICRSEEMLEDAMEREVDTAHVEDARKYFTTAPSAGGRASERHETDWEAHSAAAQSWMKGFAMDKLESERWRWESVDAV